MTESTDAYTYPGTTVLRNLRDIRDPNFLARFEAESTARRISELVHAPIQGHFDLNHLKAIHKHIFQDVYCWAGEFRTVNISRGGNLFGVPAFVEPASRSHGVGSRGGRLLCEDVYKQAHLMSETLSIRIDAGTKRRLDALSRRSKRSKSFLAAEAIAAYVESEEWQLGEIQAAMAELDAGQEVRHEKVSKWLNSWGSRRETKAPR